MCEFFSCAPPAWVRAMRHKVQKHSMRAVRVASPCVGLDAATRAASVLGCEYVAKHVYDKEPALQAGLALLYGSTDQCHLGSCAGM